VVTSIIRGFEANLEIIIECNNIYYIITHKNCNEKHKGGYMLFDVLSSYTEYLKTKYTYTTASTYTNALEFLLEGQSLNLNAGNMDIEKIIERFARIEYKNHFSKAKNAFLIFCEFLNYPLSNNHLNEIKSLEAKTRKKYRKLKAVEFSEIEKKIKGIKNPKLKLCYQTILATGLRISELAQITANNCVFSGDEVYFSFIGKGNKPETITLLKNEYPKLYEKLKKFHTALSEKTDTKMFYSAVHLQAHAKKLGFTCHDLRRAFAKLEYKKTKSKKEVMQKLRHTSMKNTNIYLRSKIKIRG